MTNKIITFESGEFEIAITTYNRCEFIEEWLQHCYVPSKIRNISLSIWDSSTNDDTKKYIENFNKENCADIAYHHVAPSTNIGYKPMFPILESKSKYVWVSGDSRCHNFDILDKKVFTHLKKDIDYVVLQIANNEENDGKLYEDKEEFLKECFVSMTCIGLSIYKTSIFEPLKMDPELRDNYDQKYKDNYAFGWIGYFLEIFSMRKYKALFSVIPIIDIRQTKKSASWFKRYYHCWIEDLCNLLDGVSEKYQCAETVIKETWQYLSLDMPTRCYEVRKKGDLNPETFNKFKDNGMLKRVSKHIDRLEKFAYSSSEQLDKCLEQEMELEEKEYEELCYRSLEKINRLSEGRELWIYGAGTGGKILGRCLLKHNVPVVGFLDKNAEKITICEGLPVKTVDNMNARNGFILISLFHWMPFITSSLIEFGIDKDHIFYIGFGYM